MTDPTHKQRKTSPPFAVLAATNFVVAGIDLRWFVHTGRWELLAIAFGLVVLGFSSMGRYARG